MRRCGTGVALEWDYLGLLRFTTGAPSSLDFSKLETPVRTSRIPALPYRAITAAVLLLAAGGASAQADFTCPPGRPATSCATAVRLMPAQPPVPTQNPSPPIQQTDGAPAGYEAVNYPIGAGAISAAAYQAAIANGYAAVTCNPGCSDGRDPASVLNDSLPCGNVYSATVYAVTTYRTQCGGGDCVSTPTGTFYRSCVTPGTTLTTLRQVAGPGATPVEVPWLTFNAKAGAGSDGTNVAYESVTLNRLCSELGYGALYGAAAAGYNTCGDNRLRVFRSGTWMTIGGCDYPSWTQRLVCWSR